MTDQNLFRVVNVPVLAGHLQLCPLPGGRHRMYLSDLSVLLAHKPDLVISLTETSEMPDPLGADLATRGIDWLHLPIPDYGVPDAEFMVKWSDVRVDAIERFKRGQNILLHCKGGCGRTGMIALQLMRIAGEDAGQALDRLRSARPCAIETEEQMIWAMEG